MNHKDKISDCSECMAELNAMGAPATPEQFLREFADAAIHNWTNTPEDLEKLIKGWAKLLELREQEAEVNKIRRLISDAKDELGHEKSYVNNAVNIQFYENVIKYLEGRYELTTPNNTSNTLEDEVTE